MSLNKVTINEVGAWCARSLIALVTWFVIDMHGDVKITREELPKMQEQIRLLQNDNENFKNRLLIHSRSMFPLFKTGPLTIDNLLKKSL